MIMRSPCPGCGSTIGEIQTKSGQDCVYCECGRWCYNAPRTETGREVRSLRTRPEIKPSQRARTLDRDLGCCIICHRADIQLDIGHLISVHEGQLLGMTEQELYDDENLAAMCAECNSGYSWRSVNPRLLINSIRARIIARGGAA